MELKNGETFNGHLVNCDNWMNLTLREVIQTSSVRHPFRRQVIKELITTGEGEYRRAGEAGNDEGSSSGHQLGKLVGTDQESSSYRRTFESAII